MKFQFHPQFLRNSGVVQTLPEMGSFRGIQIRTHAHTLRQVARQPAKIFRALLSKKRALPNVNNTMLTVRDSMRYMQPFRTRYQK